MHVSLSLKLNEMKIFYMIHLAEKNDATSGHLALCISETWLWNSTIIAKYVLPNGYLFQ